jgi:hypothetical protein
MLETLDCNESGNGLVTKKENMIKKRVGCLFLRVWNCLIYAIGGTTDGHCERFDVNLNKWLPIARHPCSVELLTYHPINIYEKYIYLAAT